MAKKGQIFRKYDDDFRNKVVNDYFNNEGGVKALAKKYNISYCTIQNWVNKIKKGETTYSLRLLPLGGACVFENEDELGGADGRTYEEGSFPAASVCCMASFWCSCCSCWCPSCWWLCPGSPHLSTIPFWADSSIGATCC